MDELTFFKNQVRELNDENLKLKTEVAYLKGKIEVYKWFLRTEGYTEGEKDDRETD